MLADVTARLRHAQLANSQLQSKLTEAQMKPALGPRSPSMVQFDALQRKLADMESAFRGREVELERILRTVEDRRQAEIHEMKRKVSVGLWGCGWEPLGREMGVGCRTERKSLVVD